MVTSVTNEALFVQSGKLVGRGGSDVGVNVGGTVEVTTGVSVTSGGSVSVAPVIGIANVSVAGGIDVSAGAAVPQAETIKNNSKNVATSFLFISTSI
jgi:hypothetical protein